MKFTSAECAVLAVSTVEVSKTFAGSKVTRSGYSELAPDGSRTRHIRCGIQHVLVGMQHHQRDPAVYSCVPVTFCRRNSFFCGQQCTKFDFGCTMRRPRLNKANLQCRHTLTGFQRGRYAVEGKEKKGVAWKRGEERRRGKIPRGVAGLKNWQKWSD